MRKDRREGNGDKQAVFAHAAWIWTAETLPERNAFVRFRRHFHYEGGPATLHITADSRYVLYANGHYLGQGPVRSWPGHWRYDTFDLEPWLHKGENALAVLVNHFGEGNFQYVPGPPGLLAELSLTAQAIASDTSWRSSPDPAFVSAVPRISCQQAYEEQYDARLADDWTAPDYDDSSWPAATARPLADGWHQDLAPRGIPFLTMEPVLPQRVVGAEAVRSLPYIFDVYAKPYLAPGDLSSNHCFAHAYLVTQIWSPKVARIELGIPPRKNVAGVKLNGRTLSGAAARLRPGWNSLVLSLRLISHDEEFKLTIDGPEGLRFSASGDDKGSPWAIVGPFQMSEKERRVGWENYGGATMIYGQPITPTASLERGEQFWQTAGVAAVVQERFFQPLRPEHVPAEDVYLRAYTDKVVDERVTLEHIDGLVSGNEWTTVHPAPGGAGVRILLDYGREVVGFHRFEVVASAGTIIDAHNFEFIQPDGRYNFAEGMNNSFRYVCREGAQTYQTYVRRGFQYTYLILRRMTGPVRLRRVEVLFNTYPQQRRGSFACSDARLEQIWQVGAHTLRCCAEDTYTDCPTYEQTHWVGDARNEALIDWAINGDPRLWYHCLEQTGQSLDRSPLTESHVPSAWPNILPAWSFLWMRSCREYYLFSGDREGGLRLLDFIRRNVTGLEQHVNKQGLFEIHAWNMFDWADMDTPNDGVVTHQNCLAVHALHDAVELAEWLGKPDLAHSWLYLADALSAAINRHLWNEERQAYTDCLRRGKHSTVYSQQTQTAAFASGVATGQRGERCRTIMHNPPQGLCMMVQPLLGVLPA